MQIGDVISALWIPNGQYYDAKILAKEGDKNELMRERMRQEKAKKGGQKEIETQQKRKNSEEEADAQKKKKKKQKQTESDKEEKQKKKEQDRERQKFFLAARRAQAATRWAADSEVTTVAVNNPVDATFTPQPIHHRSSSPSCQSSTPLNANTSLSPNKNPSTSTTTIATFTPHPIRHRSSRPLCQSSTPLTTSTTLSPDRTLTTPESIQSPTEEFLPANPPMPARPCIPARPTTSYKSKTICEPRRGLHFQSATADSSDDETDLSQMTLHTVSHLVKYTYLIVNFSCFKVCSPAYHHFL
ncbi:DNA ligase 1-like [Montipora foliosa]|uniref:DNA ligase 1-like n=1 Tax=Montipora foliosa TaxID=591990 RepID=UPI0035F2001B